ncbi:hypothetical protein ACJU26_00565 [Acidithiobacillus sp. M4-SHS-6]|uniref:hypothetical protein n=1 Tax=Acidithiobacillus sp. M4-SHS-6 TaxID=3383024 RepID=UPI0039BE62F3
MTIFAVVARHVDSLGMYEKIKPVAKKAKYMPSNSWPTKNKIVITKQHDDHTNPYKQSNHQHQKGAARTFIVQSTLGP